MADASRADGGDPHDLDRFVRAQEGDYVRALAEVRGGRKRSHWMWYVFPQLDGLGSSPTARRYAIRGVAEAEAYLAHPVLGPRLVECAEAALGVGGRSALEIFGSPTTSSYAPARPCSRASRRRGRCSTGCTAGSSGANATAGRSASWGLRPGSDRPPGRLR